MPAALCLPLSTRSPLSDSLAYVAGPPRRLPFANGLLAPAASFASALAPISPQLRFGEPSNRGSRSCSLASRLND